MSVGATTGSAVAAGAAAGASATGGTGASGATGAAVGWAHAARKLTMSIRDVILNIDFISFSLVILGNAMKMMKIQV